MKPVNSWMVFSLSATAILAGCGGGGGGSSTTSPVAPPVTPVVNTTGTETVTSTVSPVPVVTTQAQGNTTTISAALPAPLANTAPDPVITGSTLATATEVARDVYEVMPVSIRQSSFITEQATSTDCPTAFISWTTNKTCPAFQRTYLNSNNKVVKEFWAYQPVQKKWIQLEARTFTPFDSTQVTLYNTNGEWIETPSQILSNLAPVYSLTDTANLYRFLDASFELKATEKDISSTPVNIQGTSTTTLYPANSKSYAWAYVLINKPAYLLLSSVESYYGKYPSSSSTPVYTTDRSIYNNLADFINKHTSKTVPFCLETSLSPNWGVFFSSPTQASLSSSYISCTNDSGSIFSATPSNYGTVTTDTKNILLLANPMPVTQGQSTSSLQWQPVIALNTAGNVQEGRKYSVGYTKASFSGMNKTAAQAWFAAQYPDAEAVNFPSN